MRSPLPEVINQEMSPKAKEGEREDLRLLLEAATEDVVVYNKNPLGTPLILTTIPLRRVKRGFSLLY